MPTFTFEAMDATGQEMKDTIDAPNEEEAQATIRQMGYYVTKISVKKAKKKEGKSDSSKKKSFALRDKTLYEVPDSQCFIPRRDM